MEKDIEIAINPKIFISYAHTDEKYKNELKKHLSILLRIRNAGESGMTADYFDSSYCMKELKKILETDTIILPVIVRDCYWKKFLLNSGMTIITFPENNGNIYCTAFVTGTAYVFFTFQTVIIFIIPSIIAAFYLEKKSNVFYGNTNSHCDCRFTFYYRILFVPAVD